MIKCLPKEVQWKLRSGVAIPSLQQSVEELILNSIDAGATCVGVRMDMEAFKVQVIDNGAGMSADDMKCVGNRYYTSKCNVVEDLDNLKSYGFRGEALASIVSLATLVEISSRTRSSVKTHVKIFKDGKGLEVFEADTARPSAGTTVLICNFFHNMPVRRKRMDPVLEGERIRHRVEAISLMHSSVSFTLKNDCTGAMLMQLPKARNTYHRFVQIHSLGRAQKLGEISYSHGQFEVIGYIGREGHYNSSLQFLYVNDRLLLKTRLHKLLNLLLRRLSNSNQKNESPDEQSAFRSPKQKRSQELHGVYVINIKCSYSEYDICLEPAKTLIEFKDWDGILLCVEEAVKAFLSRENLVAVLSQDDFDYASPKLFGTDSAEQEGGVGGQATSSTSTQDCGVGIKLASESVHRKRRGDCVYESSICQESDLMEYDEESEQVKQRKLTAVKTVENIKSAGHINKECRDDLIHPASDNIMKEEEPTESEAGEGCQSLCMPSSVRQIESEKLELSNEPETRLNNTTPASNVTSLAGISQQIQYDLKTTRQILPTCTGTGGYGQTLVNNRKISLCDPYFHESLESQDMPQICRSAFQQKNVLQKCEEIILASKCKISLEAGHARPFQKVCVDLASNIPSNNQRIVSCQKLSLFNGSGSLDKFRRSFGKSEEIQLSSLEAHLPNSARLPQTGSLNLNPQITSLCQKDQQDGEITKTRTFLQSPLSLSAATRLQQISGQVRCKKSLAAKLCNLKQDRTEDSNVLPCLSRTTSQDNTCLSSGNDGIQDRNNNESPQDTALNPEPVSGHSTNSHLVDVGQDTTSGDWLHHYDTSAGKTVYINKVTGLSSYEDPPTEETQVHCISDVTNMAVSVVTEMGMEYRCYPFQVDLVLPFLSKSRTDRVISSGHDDRDNGDERSNSLSSLYSKWNNPVFVQPPMVGVDLSSGQADGLAVKIHNILFPYRFSKAMIHSMKVIHQVDKKFLACLINTRDDKTAAHPETEGNLLVLVDQHAAHERVRLENLIADSYEEDPGVPGEKRLCSSTILPPLVIGVTEEELRLLRSCQGHLRSLGLEVKFSHTEDPQVFVGKVPLCFMEKESNELRRGRPSIIKSIVEEYLQEQIEFLHSAGRVRGTLPLTVLKVLASLACHGAIKFNDNLSRDECFSLVASLSSCQLPFQCAHGRPSIAPLVDILHLDKDQKEFQKPNLQKLRRMCKAWELYGNR